MRKDCPRCGATIDVDLSKKPKQLFCPGCQSAYATGDLERVSYLAEHLKTIGQYRIVGYVGSGGFADVWQARDERTEELVAVKIPHGATEGQKRSLVREERATRQLHHPGIVKVRGVSEDGNRCFGVCDFVQGATLDTWLRQRSPGPTECARICASIADSIQHAHEAGVVHRDLKPSNIVVDDQGLTYIIDFGLAKCKSHERLERYQQAVHSIASRGRRLHLLGTPAYMSPEQVRGDGHLVDHLSDVYSLGVILYEMLTGSPPFRGETQHVLRQIVTEQAIIPKRLRQKVPVDLKTICLKAMSKEPCQRYATASELAQDCRRFASGAAIGAQRPTSFQLAWDWMWRKPLEALTGVWVLAMLVALAALLWHQI